MLNLLKLVSEFIFMSALTDCIVRCFIKVLFALFTAVTFSVQQFTTLVYRVIIVPIFIFVGADARFCARSHIERVPAIFMEVTISKWQVLTELHNFIISSHLFDVSASRGKVTGRSRCYIKFLVEDIIFIMYEMFIYNLSSQIYFSFIIQIAIVVSCTRTTLVIKRAAPRLPIAEYNTLIECLMIDFQSWAEIKPRLYFFEPILIWGSCI